MPHPTHRSSRNISSGREFWLSGLWHHEQERRQPLKNAVVRMPGPSCSANRLTSNRTPASSDLADRSIIVSKATSDVVVPIHTHTISPAVTRFNAGRATGCATGSHRSARGAGSLSACNMFEGLLERCNPSRRIGVVRAVERTSHLSLTPRRRSSRLTVTSLSAGMTTPSVKSTPRLAGLLGQIAHGARGRGARTPSSASMRSVLRLSCADRASMSLRPSASSVEPIAGLARLTGDNMPHIESEERRDQTR